MKTRTRNILLTAGVALVILLGISWWFWSMMGQPMYQPGALKNETVTAPEQTVDTAYWNMEEDIRLFHFYEGKGPNILTLHGGPGIPWDKPPAGFSLLADQHRLHYYHQRGSGRSSRPFDRFAATGYYKNLVTLESTLGIEAQLKDIERVRQVLGDDQIILMGHSFGAFLAALYAAEYPDKVKALVLISPADLMKFPPEHGDLFATVRKELPESLVPEFDAWQKQYLDFSGIFKKSESELQELNSEFAKYYEAALKARGLDLPKVPDAPELTGGWMVHAQYFSMGKQHDYSDALKGVQVPVLIIHGALDLQPEAASRAYAEMFPNAQFEKIANAGHFVFYEQPDTFATVVRRFLNGLD